jgi:hypothetical protein
MAFLLPPPTRWRHLDRPELDWADSFSAAIRDIERAEPEAIPDLSRGRQLYLFSDYGGDHAAFSTYAFLLVSEGALNGWRLRWETGRDALLPNGRHLEYKSVFSSDRHKRAALQPFLDGVDRMNGLLITFAIDQRIRTLFRDDKDADDRANTILAAWSPAVDERLWRIVHFAALIVSGLARRGQSVWWFSDRDAIAPEYDQQVAFRELWLRSLDTYRQGDLDDPRFKAVGDDPGETPIRDALAVPDLAAGALADILSAMAPLAMPTQRIISAVPRSTKPKAYGLLDWYARRETHLRRLLCVCTATGAREEFRSRWMTFSGFDATRSPILRLP